MYKNFILIVSGIALAMVSCKTKEEPQPPASYINPFIGTDWHGHTYPGAATPFGMVQLSPQTRLDGWDGCSGYHYSDSVIYGFAHTALNGTGVSDYGDILFMPVVGELLFFRIMNILLNSKKKMNLQKLPIIKSCSTNPEFWLR
jgi:putative alpha-1,2-mannosidase